jgi:hypothetical protein
VAFNWPTMTDKPRKSMFSNLFKRRTPAPAVEDHAEHIDRLMAGPIKQPPKITVFGDDGVMGINPAPTKPSNDT